MNNDIYLLIGKNIKKYRESKKYTIEELSKITKIDKNYLKEIEKNGVTGDITFEKLNNICNSLNIKFIDLIQK